MFQFETGDSVQWFRVKNCRLVEPKKSYAVWGHGIFWGWAMAIPDQARRCEQYARDCLRLAKRTSSTSEKELLVQMAETWRRLAEQAKAAGESNTNGD
jgi:hypothetical protein